MKAILHLFAGVAAMAAVASATTIDFSSALTLGNLPQSVSIDGLTFSAWKVWKMNGTVWSGDAILNNRNDAPSDIGLGVCSNAGNCPAGGGGTGDINEIDNNGWMFEVVRIDTGGTAGLSGIGLSSLDSGLKDGYAIFGSDTALPNLSLLTPLASGTNQSAGTVTPEIPVSSTFQYYFVTSLKRGIDSSGSDFLMNSVSLNVSRTPEPLTLGLIGLGLVGLAVLGRKRKQRGS